MIMESVVSTEVELLPPNPIRVETATTRYPIHRLSKHRSAAINIRETNDKGEVLIRWQVNHNSNFGDAGPFAYKIDTLLVNRRIEEASQPMRGTRRIPKLIKLGGLTDICRELRITDSGNNTQRVKVALHQNASTYINPKISYRQSDGTEQTLETGFTRYSVIFTGEKLPNGRKADAVYILLNDIYMQVLNGAMTRPLDYDYLKSLSPAPQRFYELISYQMYATIKNDRPRAKLIYSQFCTYAPQTRQFDWEHARKQMAKVHRPHKASGYIADIDYEQTTDADGQPDWIMFYKPGPKARAEYRAFAKRGGPVMLEAEPFTDDPLPQLAAPELSPLAAELVKRGVSEAIAADLVQQQQAHIIQQQIEILDFRLAGKKADKIDDPAAWLVSAIKKPHMPPKGFTTQAERHGQAEAARQAEREAAAKRRQEREQEARGQEHLRKVNAHLKQLDQAQRLALEAQVLAAASPDDKDNYESPGMAPHRETLMLFMTREYLGKRPELLEQVGVDA
jgi:hypothetical protein